MGLRQDVEKGGSSGWGTPRPDWAVRNRSMAVLCATAAVFAYVASRAAAP